MTAIWIWLAANSPVWAPILGAAISLLYSALEKSTWGHSLLNFFAAALPLDLPKMTQSLTDFIVAVSGKEAKK